MALHGGDDAKYVYICYVYFAFMVLVGMLPFCMSLCI